MAYTQSDDEEEKERRRRAAAGKAAGGRVSEHLRTLDAEYSKPSDYTGNRELYDSAGAKIAAKQETFKGGAVRDPYTGERLLLHKSDAQAQYGAKWQDHHAEADHIVPIEKVHQMYKDDPWLTNADIQTAVNNEANLSVTSRRFNNAKRSRTNEELVSDDAYMQDKGLHIGKKGKARAREDGEKAQAHIERQLRQAKVGNIVGAFHSSGANAAVHAGGMTAALSTMDNMIAVVKGEKKPAEALKAIALDTGSTTAMNYVLGGSLTVAARTLSGSSSPFVQTLVRANVPGKVVSAVMSTGGTLMKYAKGEIGTSECILELGTTGVGTVTTGYAAAVGQAFIPIPLVGAAVGALVGSAVSEAFYNNFKEAMDRAELARAEYEQVRAAADAAIARMNAESAAFEAAASRLFARRTAAVSAGFAQLERSSQRGDINGLIAGLDQIARAYGKDIQYHSFDEFDAMMRDNTRAFEL